MIDEPVTDATLKETQVVVDEPDVPEVDDDPEPQKPWRVVPLKSKRRTSVVIDGDSKQEHNHHHWYPKHRRTLYTMLYTTLLVLALVFVPTAVCFWCARRRGYVMYQRVSTTPTAPPAGYGTFEGPRGGYYAGHAAPTVMMVAPSHPYAAHEVKIHPNPN